MKVLIIEDELPTQRYITGLIEQLRPQWHIVACIESVADAVSWLNQNPQPDVILSDIQLADGICFDIFEQVKVTSFVVFTTAYDEYAIQAFKVNSLDYLLKPIDPDELEKAILKMEAFYEKTEQEKDARLLSKIYSSLNNGQAKYRQRLLINTSDGFIKINTKDIAWFYSSNKITSAYGFNKKQHVVDQTLEKLDSQLDPATFYRVNRQFILHIDSIVKIETWFNGKLVVKTKPATDEKIIVSRDKARAFKEWINQ